MKDNKKKLVEEKLKTLKKEYEGLEMTEEQVKNLKAKMEEAKKIVPFEKKVKKYLTVAAVFLGATILLPNTSYSVAHAMEKIPVLGKVVKVVTFREYKYETNNKSVDISVLELQTSKGDESNVNKEMKKSTEEVNKEVKKITNKIIKNLEKELKEDKGYKEVIIQSEVLETNEEYFSLKLMCYEAEASGYEFNYFYTIDLSTGKSIKLKDLFKKDADYKKVISDNIKNQMKEQMKSSDEKDYWLDEEFEEDNFKTITDETSFYINKDNNIIIAFNEGEVAPMYMGAVEFVIPSDIVKDIRK